MARDTRAAFLRALAQVEPRVARAFEAAIMDVRSTAQQRVIEEAIRRAIETGNIAQGVQEVAGALQLGREFWAPLDKSIQEAFEAGATYQLSLLPKRPSNTAPQLVARFDPRNPRAERWTRENAAQRITEITEDTRLVIRDALTEAAEAQRPYRAVTRDLIGTTQGNERKGGLIGLHSSQARAVRNARADLENLSTDYFRRERRDKRFDGTVRKAIKEEKPLSRADISRITGRYSDRLLQLRGETIARTEGNKAMVAGRVEAIEQLIDSGKVRPDLITKVWRATIGQFTRDHHLAMNGTEVKWGEKFISPKTGYPMDHPHDENAPAVDVVNCRCTMATRIAWHRMAT